MMSKLTSLKEAMQSLENDAVVALGGNTLNRAPMAAVYEMARQGKKHLHLVKTAGAMDVDLLCLAGCVQSVDAGFVSLESRFGLCRNWRRLVEEGTVQHNEHACYTVISALRAAACGLPFMPVRGLTETSLFEAEERFAKVRDPFGGSDLMVVKAIVPDVAILHVHKADEKGNAFILGSPYDDIILSRAAGRVIITAEDIVPESFLRRAENKAQIPHFLVDHVVHAPGGAAPCAVAGYYRADEDEVRSYLALPDKDSLFIWLHDRRRAYA
jgi:glutaconate CoA-transferase subunit A